MPRTCRENAENLLTQPPRLRGSRPPRSAPPSHTGHAAHAPGPAIRASVCITRAQLTRGTVTAHTPPRLAGHLVTRVTGHAGLGGLGVTWSRWARVSGSLGLWVSGSLGLWVSGARGHGSCVRVREGGEGRGRSSPRFTCCFTCEARVSKVKQGAVLSRPSGTRGCSLRARVWRVRL